jgi:hypothetical protein
MSDTIARVVDSLLREPVTYLNVGTAAVSMMPISEYVKIGFYIVSIVASIVVTYKYLLEIKKLKQDE